MHLFIKYSIFHIVWPNFGPRFWDIFSISGNALMNLFFSIVISCEKAIKRFWGYADPMHLFIKDSIFHNFWPNLSDQILRYFLNFRKCAYESLLQHRNILRKSEKWFCEVLRIRCTFSSKIQFFIMFDLTLAQILRYFLNFRKCAYESLLQHRNILRKSENGSEVMRIRCTFSLKIQFFILFGLTLGPDFEIFSQFQEMRLWISSSAS